MKSHFFQLLCLFLIPLLVGCKSASPKASSVRIKLNDQQVLVGELTTAKFTLQTELGTFDFVTTEAGEMGPVKGKDVKTSKSRVRLWLRNGSEFVGSWQKKRVNMVLKVGKRLVPTEVPIDKIARLQFEGRPVWRSHVHRVQTKSGDDFFVDADLTQVHFTSEFGTFSPFLRELNFLQAIEDKPGKWRVYFKNGTTLNVEMESQIHFFLTMGPEEVKVATSQIKWIERQVIHKIDRLAPPSESKTHRGGGGEKYRMFYSNQSQKKAKEKADQTYKSWRRYKRNKQNTQSQKGK